MNFFEVHLEGVACSRNAVDDAEDDLFADFAADTASVAAREAGCDDGITDTRKLKSGCGIEVVITFSCGDSLPPPPPSCSPRATCFPPP